MLLNFSIFLNASSMVVEEAFSELIILLLTHLRPPNSVTC